MISYMWLFTLNGFYSAVQDRYDDRIIWVRARVEDDLKRLIQTYDVSTTGITVDSGTDYKYRISVWREEWVRVVSASASDIYYTNFKGEVESVLGKPRATILEAIWFQLFQLQYSVTQVAPRNNSRISNIRKLFGD